MSKSNKKNQPTRISSTLLPDGCLVEMLYDPANHKSQFAIWDGKHFKMVDEVQGPSGLLLPYSADNPIVKDGTVLFPSTPSGYGETKDLVADIRRYIRAYVDLSDSFELLVAYYVLFTWVYDRFNELPYVRLQGTYGTGKTRFLLVVGSICRTPIFTAGASTTSPIFHMLDEFRGTLLMDEADLRFSNETAQIAKILNNGNARGFPVLRTETINGREFRPRHYQVFGPKLIAMRGEFGDAALESRFITERSDGRKLRADIPINLPAKQQADALELRDKLLMFRFRHFVHAGEVSGIVDPALDPRTNQIFAPLLSIMDDEEARDALRLAARERQQFTDTDRSSSSESGVLAALLYLLKRDQTASIPLSDIADLYSRAHAAELSFSVTSKWVGGVLRKALGLYTRKSSGGMYVLPAPSPDKLAVLRARYRIADDDLARYAEFDVAEALTRVIPLDPYEGGAQRS
jgi:hypothetical protein